MSRMDSLRVIRALIEARTACAAICLGLCLLVALPAASEAFDEEKQAEIESIVHRYLVENPEVLREVIDALRIKETAQQEREDREKIGALRSSLDGGESAYVGGNPEGDVTLIEFFDYTCGYCRRALADVEKLVETDGNLRIIYKEFPVLGPVAVYASRAAIASTKQGKYLEFHGRLMGSEVKLSEEVVLEIAEDIGLDVKQLKKDLASEETTAHIDNNHGLALNLGISGTPNFIVGDQIVQGAQGYDILRAAIEQARMECQTC